MIKLSHEQNLQDAGRVITALTTIESLRPVLGNSWVSRAAREAVKIAWEVPRLGGRDDVDLLWSRTAAEVFLKNGRKRRGGDFVVEHVVPAKEVVGRVLKAVGETETESTAQLDAVAEVLTNWSILAVLHKEEDLALRTNGRFQRRMPTPEELAAANFPGDFPEQWSRYLLCDPNFHPDQFRPIAGGGRHTFTDKIDCTTVEEEKLAA